MRLHGKSQDVPGRLGTKGIWLTWDLHVRYINPQWNCHRCTHFTYKHVRPACVQWEYHSWAAPRIHTYQRKAQPSNYSHYSAMIQLCTYMYMYMSLHTAHVHVYTCTLVSTIAGYTWHAPCTLHAKWLCTEVFLSTINLELLCTASPRLHLPNYTYQDLACTPAYHRVW